MGAKLIFHGSNVEVAIPRILQNGFYKDFGYGFYCTELEKQAIRWAMTKHGASIVSKYSFVRADELRIMHFPAMSDSWLDFVAECRTGKEHTFDIVEGPMADDQIWNYVEGFLDGRISRTAFWELAKFSHPTHQIVFCTEKSLETLHFEGGDMYGK